VNGSKVLVTGGAGFIGSHVADKLIHNGYNVVIIDNLSAGKVDNVNKKAKFYNVDIRSSEVERVFEKEKPGFVCHLAAQKDVRVSVNDPALDAQINILGTINILENCRKFSVKKIVFASTGGAIYGEQEVFPAPETHPARPISPYGITKLVAEHYMYYYHVVHGLDYISLRYANVYGPRQDPDGEAGVVAIFIRKMLSGDVPTIFGSGEQTRDFVYVEDVAEANILSLKYEGNSHIFNIGTGVETSINQLYSHLASILEPSQDVRYGEPKEGEQLRSVIDSSRAFRDFNWQPLTPLRDGLQKTCDSFK
jgi:UDP-glucose 4-epimerase